MAKNSLLDKMREQINKSGSNKKEILYFAKDTVKRVRFLQELDTGYAFEFHNDFDLKIMELCHDPEDHENCKLCEDGIYIQEMFVWSVWDYDSNSVKLLQFKASGVSPVPQFMEYFEEYGTILDRDYKIKKVGQGQGGSFAVTPLDKVRFKNAKAKAMSRKAVQDILEKAWPSKANEEADLEEEEDEEKKPSKKSKKGKKKEKSLREKFEELSMKDLKNICLEIGMSKKEIKEFEDEEEILDELFDNYEEEDLAEMLEDMEVDEDEED